MSQSRVISVLLRAGQITNDQKYFEFSRSVVEAFFINYEKGSFLIKDAGRLMFEEMGTQAFLITTFLLYLG